VSNPPEVEISVFLVKRRSLKLEMREQKRIIIHWKIK
jgi:hypothetical protein